MKAMGPAPSLAAGTNTFVEAKVEAGVDALSRLENAVCVYHSLVSILSV